MAIKKDLYPPLDITLAKALAMQQELLLKEAKASKPASTICMGCQIPVCSVCNVCHTIECKYYDKRVTDAAMASKYRYLDARTQKAKGFVTLEQRGFLEVPKPYYLILAESDIRPAVEDAYRKDIPKLFVRPCPIRARHGFEESRPVSISADFESVIAEVTKIWNAANAADEEHAAELLMLPYVEARYNSIITPTRAAVGPNHDGATSGYESISIPLAGVPFKEQIEYHLADSAGLTKDDDPYFEVVAKHLMMPVFTQLRAGVKLSSDVGEDYVPAPMRVKEVIDAAGDLLEWEQQVKTIKPGTVVVKLGGTLISHYGVHCLYNKVPCLTTRRPSVGELLDPVGVTPNPSPQAVIKGLGDGALVPLLLDDGRRPEPNAVDVRAALIMMMTVLHNAKAMNGENGYWLGMATSVMMRAGMAASHGEARHKLQDLQNMRSYVYRLAFKDFMGARNTIGTAQWMFENLYWSSSYGGKAWANCTKSILNMDAAVQSLLQEPTPLNVSAVVSSLNVAVNQAHNGGWWLNKFIEQQFFDAASKQSLNTLAIAVHTMFHLHRMEKQPQRAEELIAQWRNAHPIEVKPGGKLHVQLLNKEIDQTAFTKKEQSTKLSQANKKVDSILIDRSNFSEGLKQSLLATGNKMGAYCQGCGAHYNWFTDHDIPAIASADVITPTTCGGYTPNGPCKSHVGWYDGETLLVFQYVEADLTMTDDETPDDYDFEPELEEEPEQEVALPVPEGVNVPSTGGQYFGGIDSMPSIKTLLKTGKQLNVNGMASSAQGVVTLAQMNFTQAGENQVVAHMQFKTSNILQTAQYFSCNTKENITVSPEVMQQIKAGQKHPLISWSGSGVFNYWSAVVEQVKVNLYNVKVPQLGLNFVFTPSDMGLNYTEKVEEAQDVETPQPEQVEEIPF